MTIKEQFDAAVQEIYANPASFMGRLFPLMTDYKKSIQTEVIPMLSYAELLDIRNSRLNEEVINKLSRLAKSKWSASSANGDSLYCAAMAVGTIIKEYGWGTQYIAGDGLWKMAQRIMNA